MKKKKLKKKPGQSPFASEPRIPELVLITSSELGRLFDEELDDFQLTLQT